MDQEPLSPFYYSTKKTTPVVSPVAETATEDKPATRVPEILSEECILENLRRMLPRYMEKYRNTAEVRQRFREERQKVYPNHHHLIEQVLSEMLPTEGQASLPVPVPEEPAMVPETKDILSVSEVPEPESRTTRTADTWVDEVLSEVPSGIPQSQPEEPVVVPEPKNTISISETKKEEMLRSVIKAQWKAGVPTWKIMPAIQERVDKLGWQGNLRWLVETTIEILADEEDTNVPPVPAKPIETVKEVPPLSDDEEWVSTWDLALQERLQAIVDFMEQDGRTNYTRQQIEIGAGYRHPDDRLDEDTYKKMSRRLQRDLEMLIEDGDIVRSEQSNPRQKGGFRNKMYLYALAPVQNEPPQWSTPDLKKHLRGALDAFDAHDLVKLKDYLTTALDALDAFDGQ